MSLKNQWLCLAAAALLSACGGGGDDAPYTPEPPASGPTSTTAPGGLYVGYYQESPQSNPEDPEPGAFVLSLPAKDADFTGSMFFTYIGCQSSNVGTISGSKLGFSLAGKWSGTVDGTAQSGTYTGAYDKANSLYSGTYLNSGGKQSVDLSPCTRYVIAPNGTWEMFPMGTSRPANFTVTVDELDVAWPTVQDAAYTLVYVLDPAIAATGKGNPVVWQTVSGPAPKITIPPMVNLRAGKQYLVAVAVSDSNHTRKAFASKLFTVVAP